MKLFDIIRRCKWDLAIMTSSQGHRYDDSEWVLHIIKAPKDKWYADPFILEVAEDYIYLLVEELEHKTNKGRLAKLTIDIKTFKIVSEKIILDIPTHLSFPAIYRNNDEIYIYPENSASEKCVLYKYNILDDSLSPCSTLAEQPLTDAVMLDYAGGHYIFSTQIPTQNGSNLLVMKSENKISDYQVIQEIDLESNTARSAGDFIIDGGKIIKVSQNCNGGYGIGLVFYEVRFDDGKISLKEILRKYPPQGYCGMHTYNSYKNYAVVDLHTHRYPLLYKFFRHLKMLFKHR